MAEKELRRMSREELVEIIYAMQQSQHQLEQQNEELRTRLDDRTLKWEQAGSLAEAALSLNHAAPRAETGVRLLRKNAICTKAGCTRLAKRVQ